jgi:hypothetical protein
MWIEMNEQFRSEAKRFNLAFTCESCTHFCAGRQACQMQYPTKPHRNETVLQTEDTERIYFCKMFEAK